MIPEIHPSEVKEKEKEGYSLIDVRNPDEFTGELGHIDGAKLITLGEELSSWLKEQDKDSKIIFICRSGGRSGRATEEAINLGIKNSINMTGGMLLWNELNSKA
jgi:hydroxyacylglutathione hydrolase